METDQGTTRKRRELFFIGPSASQGQPKRARPGAHVHGTCRAVSEKQGRPREIRAVTVGAKIWIAALTMELGAAQGGMVGPSLARPGTHTETKQG